MLLLVSILSASLVPCLSLVMLIPEYDWPVLCTASVKLFWNLYITCFSIQYYYIVFWYSCFYVVILYYKEVECCLTFCHFLYCSFVTHKCSIVCFSLVLVPCYAWVSTPCRLVLISAGSYKQTVSAFGSREFQAYFTGNPQVSTDVLLVATHSLLINN